MYTTSFCLDYCYCDSCRTLRIIVLLFFFSLFLSLFHRPKGNRTQRNIFARRTRGKSRVEKYLVESCFSMKAPMTVSVTMTHFLLHRREFIRPRCTDFVALCSYHCFAGGIHRILPDRFVEINRFVPRPYLSEKRKSKEKKRTLPSQAFRFSRGNCKGRVGITKSEHRGSDLYFLHRGIVLELRRDSR